jgi:hypothetical protein
MGDSILHCWIGQVPPREHAGAIVRYVAPLLRDEAFKKLPTEHYVSRHANDPDIPNSVSLRVFTDSENGAKVCSVVEKHLSIMFGMHTVDRTDPMLARDLDWYRKALSLVTTVAVEVLVAGDFRLSAAIVSDRDLFTTVGREILSKVLTQYSTTYASLRDQEQTRFWADISTGVDDEKLPCYPGHWLWNLLAF